MVDERLSKHIPLDRCIGGQLHDNTRILVEQCHEVGEIIHD